MVNRILIRSSLARWPLITCCIVGIALAIIGIFTALSKDDMIPLGAILAGIGIITLLSGIVYDFNRQKKLMWLTLETARFTVTDNIGERSFKDDDVVSMALQTKDNYTNGSLTSTTRTFRIWVVSQSDQPELIPMESTNKIIESPPLQPFIDRIVHLMMQRTAEDRLRNLSILGEGWELTKSQLQVRSKAVEMDIPLSEIVAAQPVDGKLKIWRTGTDEAVAQLPLNAANAHLLYLLLLEQLAQRPKEEAPPAGQLGHILFEKKTQKSVIVILFIVGISLLVLSAVLGIALGVEKQKEPEALAVVMVVIGILGLVFTLLAFGLRRTLFRCHAHGVYKKGLSGEQTLHYHEVEEFTYSATKMYNHGSYIGTYVRLAFVPRAESGKKKIVHVASVKNVDVALEELRDAMGQRIGQRWAAEVLAGKTITWTNQLTLEPSGLRYMKVSFFSKGEPSVIPYEAIHHHTLTPDTLSLFQAGRPKPFITEVTTKKNFYAGYAALLSLMERS